MSNPRPLSKTKQPALAVHDLAVPSSASPATVFATTNGIGGYDLRSPIDQAFSFDYDSSGKLDHIVLTRPGRGAAFIVKRRGGLFEPVYAQGDGGGGIGGYDLKSTDDQAFAFDYESSGKLDHIALMRPGKGVFYIVDPLPAPTP
jgi:hypothetical protein